MVRNQRAFFQSHLAPGSGITTMVVDASSRHPSMVLDPRNRQPHVEHADHRGVERLGLHLEQQRHGSLYGSPIPNRAACLPVQRSQIRNACGVRRARWGPRPSTCGRTYPAPVDPAYANRQQHGPTTQHPNRACPVSYSTMGPDIVVPTIVNSSTMMGRRVSWREISEQAVAP